MKNILLTIIAFLIFSAANAFTTSERDSLYRDSLYFEKKYHGMTEDQIAAYEDSVVKANYPAVHILTNPIADGKVLPSQTQRSLSAGNGAIVNTIVPNTANINTTYGVDEIEIQSEALPSGAKGYTVPIKAYTVEGSLSPQLSLNYNSMQGNGIVGKGWAIGGLSVITRGNKTIYFDDMADGLKMNKSDAFYLDGLRLVLISSASGSYTYETEQGKIKVVGYFSGDIMKYFKVYYPNGNSAVFGYTSNSSNQPVYPVTSISDLRGKTISYTYTKPANIYHISQIQYNGTKILFNYSSSRLDPIRFYCYGSPYIENYLLSSIECQFAGTTTAQYSLTYETKDNVSTLKQVGYSSGGTSLNPLVFYYGDHETSYSYETPATTQVMQYYSEPKYCVMRSGRFSYFNNRGGLIVYPNKNCYFKYHRYLEDSFINYYEATDTILVYPATSSSIEFSVPLQAGTGFIDMLCADLYGTQEDCIVKVNNSVDNDNDQITFTVYRGNGTTGLSTAMTRTFSFSTIYTDFFNNKSIQPKYYYAGDFNGNGKMEILAVSVANPFGESNHPSKCYLFDLINNTLLYEGSLFTFCQQFCGSVYDTEEDFPEAQERVFVMDYNGDGKTDICHVDGSGLKIYSFSVSGSSWTGSLAGTYTGLNKSTLRNRQFMPAELNGDGMTDVLVSTLKDDFDDHTWKAYESMGNGQFSYYTMSGPSNVLKPVFFMQDVNSDGITDMVRLEDSSFSTSIVNNKMFTNTCYINASSINIAPVDINSHSRSLKLATIDNTGVISWYGYSKNEQKDLLLTGAVNSKGVIEKNGYEHILHNTSCPWGMFYSVNSDVTFPYVNISEPIAFLAATEIYYKGTLKDYSRYTYENAVIHRQGLGFRGFKKITSVNTRGQHSVFTYNPCSFSTLSSVESPSGKSSYNYVNMVQGNKIRTVIMVHSMKENYLSGMVEHAVCQYDTYGNMTKQTRTFSDGAGETTEIAYSCNTAVENGYHIGIPNSRKRTVTRNSDTYTERTYTTSFNSAMQPLNSYVTVNGNTVSTHTFAYDGSGNMTAETVKKYADNNTLTSTYTYDAYGRPLQKTDPAGLSTQYTYNSRGKVGTMVDFLGNTTSFTYNNLGQPTTTTFPDGTTKTTAYTWTSDTYGSLWKITKTATGKPQASSSVDAFGRETLSTQQLIDKTVYIASQYDDYGNLTHKSLPFSSGETPHYSVSTFDAYNRITSMTEPGGSQTTYSYSGNTVTTTTDSRSVTKTYNSQGEVTSVTDPAGTITYTLAADGQPVSITAPGNAVTSFCYDQTRRRTSLTDPSFGTTTYTYDSRGNLATETDADGNTCSYTYDSLDRVVEKETPDLTVAYTYNSLGQLISAVGDNSTARRFTYDTYGRISTEKYEAPDSKWLQKAYTYSNGNVSSTAYTSQSGTLATENYSYYSGHMLETTANGYGIGYCSTTDNFGQPLQITRGSLTDSYTYTDEGLPTGHTAAWGNSTVQNFTYTFSPLTGNLSSRRDNIAGITENFTYDSLDRLTAFGGKTVQYDTKGNILSKSDVGTFGYNLSSKPYAVTDISQTAAAIPSASQNITYNYFRQPLTITEGTHAASFIYDGEDCRVKMQITQSGSNKLTRYYLGGCYETDITPSGTTERLYLGGDYYTAPAVLVKTSSGASLYYIVRDHLGSITHVLNTSGTDLQHLSYDAWGRLRNPSNQQVYSAASTPTILLGRGYTGHEQLTDFGLINMNGRLYDPVLGRFLSPDNYVQSPFFSQNFNRYTYCLNNPLRYTDKDGDWILELALAIVGAYIGGVASNSGELNPGHWNYREATTWLGMGIGAIIGYAGGCGLSAGTISFGVSISTPWISAGVMAGSSAAGLGKGTNWKYNFHWTTAAGGGGTTEYSLAEIDEKVGQIFDDAVDDMRSYYNRYSSDIHTGLDAAGLFLDLADGANALLYSLEGDYTNAGISAASMVPVIGSFATVGKNAWKANDIIKQLGNRQTKSSLKKGIQIHSSYKLNEVIPGHAVKEYTGINGIRPDFVDLDNYIIYELKPGNKNGVFRGFKQLEKYKSIFEKEMPGNKWNTILELY